jgi:hypothetical protein
LSPGCKAASQNRFDLASRILGNNGLPEKLMPETLSLREKVGRAVLGLVVVLMAAGTAAAGQGNEPPNPLASVKSLKCRFPTAAAVAWKEGEPKAEIRTQELNFEVNNIDTQDGTAEYVGTAGRVFVSAVLSGWSIYFVETSVGQLNVTTVFAQEASPKKLKAVHARHGYLQMSVGKFISEPSVSQSYGTCEMGS